MHYVDSFLSPPLLFCCGFSIFGFTAETVIPRYFLLLMKFKLDWEELESKLLQCKLPIFYMLHEFVHYCIITWIDI